MIPLHPTHPRLISHRDPKMQNSPWGSGVRAEWQKRPKTLARLQRMAATACGSRWQPDRSVTLELGHPGVENGGATFLESREAAGDRAVDGVGIAHQLAV